MHRLAILGATMLAAAMPASAVETRFRVTGVLGAPTGAVAGIPLAAGDRFSATFTLAGGGQSVATTPLGGAGQGRAYLDTLRALDIVLITAAGSRRVGLRPGALGNGLVYDDGLATRTPGRVDYGGFVVPVDGGPGGIVPRLATDLALPGSAYLANFSFARIEVATGGALPGLLTSTAEPEWRSFLGAPGAEFFGLFSFRATTTPNFNLQPLTEVAVGQVTVTVLPEPGTWALLIGGFGAIGATARRRRAATPAGL